MNQPRAYLTIAKGNEVNRQYVLRPGQKFTIGRTFDCAISLSDKSISRRHATVEFSNRGLQIIDLGSSNGTKVDGKPLLPNQPYFIDKDDLLAVGEHVFRIQLTGLVKPDESFEATKRLPRHVVPPEEFEILGEIGRGATGVVYGALQKNLRRNVALKIPRMDENDKLNSNGNGFNTPYRIYDVTSSQIVLCRPDFFYIDDFVQADHLCQIPNEQIYLP